MRKGEKRRKKKGSSSVINKQNQRLGGCRTARPSCVLLGRWTSNICAAKRRVREPFYVRVDRLNLNMVHGKKNTDGSWRGGDGGWRINRKINRTTGYGFVWYSVDETKESTREEGFEQKFAYSFENDDKRKIWRGKKWLNQQERDGSQCRITYQTRGKRADAVLRHTVLVLWLISSSIHYTVYRRVWNIYLGDLLVGSLAIVWYGQPTRTIRWEASERIGCVCVCYGPVEMYTRREALDFFSYGRPASVFSDGIFKKADACDLL